MKRQKNHKTAKLIAALEFIDVRFIEEAGAKIKERPVSGMYFAAGDRKKTVRQMVALVACIALLIAAVPLVTYFSTHLPEIIASIIGEQTTDTDAELTETEITPEETTLPVPETTEEVKHEHNGSEGLIYQINEDGVSATLISGGSCQLMNVQVASRYDGVPVTAIGDYALADLEEMQSLKIPESVKSIGIGAFKNCKNLSSVVIPDTVSYIGANAFENCTSLWVLFLPDALEVIESGLFTNCTALKTVEARNKVRRIIKGAFYGCTALTGLNFNGTSREWNEISKGEYWNIGSAIRQVDCNTGTIKVPAPPEEDSAENDGTPGLEYKLSGVEATLMSVGTCTEKNIVIASTYRGYPVKWIASGVFEGCSDIESVTIPETVVSIGSLAFADCTSLESIYIPASVGSIYSDAFRGCSSLKTIGVDTDNAKYKAVDNCLIQKDSSTLVFACEGCKIPADGSVTSIGSYAFSGMDGLTELLIPEGVTSIMANAIYDCVNLKTVTLPSTITNLHINFISGLESITSLTFPNGNNTYTIEGNCLIDKANKTVLRGYSGSIIPDWITAIGDDAFRGCTNLVSINFPSSLRTIGNSAFRDCTALERIKIHGNVTIMSYAFMYCSNLREVDLGNGVSFGYGYAHIFAYCTGLESISLPESVTRLVSQFEGCTNLREIILHDNITELSGAAFYGCSKLKSVYIGSKVQKLPSNLFEGCKSLTEIVYGGTKHDWYTIEKDSSWMTGAQNLEYVVCVDGSVTASSDTSTLGSFGLIYEINPDGNTATLVGFKNDVSFSGEIVISPSYYGKPVTGISAEAMDQLRNYSGVLVLSSNMNQIPERQFALKPNLKSVVITPGVSSIGDDAFIGCIGMTELTFRGYKSAWEKIEKSDQWNRGAAFTVVHCLDGDVEITPHPLSDDGSAGLQYYVSSEGYATFAGIGTCTETEIVIATNYMGYPVKGITQGALRGNTTVKKVVIPDGIEEISPSAFYECTALVTVSLPDTLRSIGDSAFSGCSSLKNVKLPASLRSIGDYAFGWCSALTSIDLPEGLTSLSGSAFLKTSIKKLYIPKNVTELGWISCETLEALEIHKDNPKYRSVGNCFIDKETKTLIQVFGKPQFPTDGSIEIFGEGALWGRDDITELIIPEGVTYLWNNAIGNNENLKKLHIPSTLEKIEYPIESAFRLKNLEVITVAAGNKTYYAKDNCLIEKETGKLILVNKYGRMPTDGSVKSIGYGPFAGFTWLRSIEIPEGVVSIGSSAFSGCTSLASVSFPESLESIGSYAFGGCTSLKKVELGDNVKHFGTEVFAGCTALEEIRLPKEVEYWAWGIFERCTSLKRIVVPYGVKDFDCRQCTSLTEVILSETVIFADFAGCTALRTVILPQSMTSMYDMFYGCTALREIVIPSGLTKIYRQAFYNCTSLERIVIEGDVTEIGANAFRNCTSLETITLPATLSAIKSEAFRGCTSLREIVFEGSMEEWNKITKGANWDTDTVLAVIRCSDGTVTADAQPEDYSDMSKIPEALRDVLLGKSAFRYAGKGVDILLEDIETSWEKGILKEKDNVAYAVVDMDGDGKLEVVVSTYVDAINNFNNGDKIILREEGGVVYGYHFGGSTLHNGDYMKDIKADGSFTWCTDMPYYNYTSTITFSGESYTIKKHCRYGNSDYYIGESKVTVEEYNEYLTRFEKDHVIWYDLDRFPIEAQKN